MQAALPAWAASIRSRYLRGEASLFLLHGNVFDLIGHGGNYHELVDFLTSVLLEKNKQALVVYDPSNRVHVLKPKGSIPELGVAQDQRAPQLVLPALEALLLSGRSTGVVIPYVDMLVPHAEMHFLSEHDRINLMTLHRWSLDPFLARSDSVVFVIAEQLASVHPALVTNPRVACVEIPLPDLDARRSVCRTADPKLTPEELEQLARHTAGLKVRQTHDLVVHAHGDEVLLAGGPARFDAADASQRLDRVRARKRALIETECSGLIEFMEPSHDFSKVGGMEEIKAELRKVARAIRQGDRARVPMGLLLVGPMGTGKTFVASAFANESGITALKLKNFRSKWVGSTEANLEKVLSVVKALGPTLLIIDEGDRSLGDAADSDGGTSSRVIARLKEFMSDPSNRGNVVFMLMTNRPDKLDADIKRAGRLDRKIPFFYAGNAEEVEGILLAQFARHGIAASLSWPADRATTSERLVGYSNADLEAVVLLANELVHEADGSGERSVGREALEAAIADYLPTRDEAMLRYMELLAVFEASSRRLLPPKYRDMSNEDLDRALRSARAALDPRHV